jgi:hypothetical protein
MSKPSMKARINTAAEFYFIFVFKWIDSFDGNSWDSWAQKWESKKFCIPVGRFLGEKFIPKFCKRFCE